MTQRLVERIGFFIRAGQFRFSAGMKRAEDVIVDHNMVVTQVLGRLGKRLDRPGIAAKLEPADKPHQLSSSTSSFMM